MQNEYRKQIDNLEVNLSTTNATLLRRENEIKMLREGVSYFLRLRLLVVINNNAISEDCVN